VTLVAVTELRSWGAQDFPRVYAESDLAAELEVHRRLVLALGVGVTAARGGTTEAWVAGLPPSGLTTGRAWLAPRWTLGRGWSAIGEVSGETSGPAYGRLRLMGGVEARFGRVSGQGPRPSAQPGMVFVLNAPGSDLVELVGSFTGWSPLPMERWPDGSWVLALDLPPGEHAYVYLVDGRPVTPPEAVVRRPDGFGGENGVITVAAPSPAPGD
jgi:hypothetical protein